MLHILGIAPPRQVPPHLPRSLASQCSVTTFAPPGHCTTASCATFWAIRYGNGALPQKEFRTSSTFNNYFSIQYCFLLPALISGNQIGVIEHRPTPVIAFKSTRNSRSQTLGIQCTVPVPIVQTRAVDPDPHSFSLLDPDPHS